MMAESIQDKFKKELLDKYTKNKKYLIPKDEYYKLIEEIKAGNQAVNKNRQHYYKLAKYEVFQCADVEKLIRKRSSPDETPCYFATIEDTFDIIKRAHIATGHGGRDRMLKELCPKYANITAWTIEVFKSYCMECQRKRKRKATTGVVVRPILSEEFNSRGQVDLIDMQSMPSNTFRWIMVYQDHLTKFCILRALTSKRAAICKL